MAAVSLAIRASEPPPGLIGLIVPLWPSASFWPLLFVNKFQVQPYVIDLLLFDSPSGIFTLGNYKESLLGSDSFTSSVLAVKLDGS